MTDPSSITVLLDAWKHGDRSVENRLGELIYPTLRRLASLQVRRNDGALTLSATELANEAYEKLHRQRGVDWQSRNHFFAIASTIIRRIAVDYLRQRSAEKRGSGVIEVSLHDLTTAEEPASAGFDLLALDQALNDLAAEDPDCARVVEMRVFSGMTVEQVAEACDTSSATVWRQWRFARAWIAERME